METCNEIERPVDCIFDSPELKVEGGVRTPKSPPAYSRIVTNNLPSLSEEICQISVNNQSDSILK